MTTNYENKGQAAELEGQEYSIPMSAQPTGQVYSQTPDPMQPPQYAQSASPVSTPGYTAPLQQQTTGAYEQQPAAMQYQQIPVQQPQATYSQGTPQQYHEGQPQLPTYIQPDTQQQPMAQAQTQPPIQMQSHTAGAGSNFQTAVPIPALSMGPAPVNCPSCGTRAMTKISYHAGNTTHAWAALTYCFTLCLCFIPYMLNSLKDVQHRCGNCGVLLATWHKSGVVDVHMHG